MTMPHLMNCSHSEDGWCLACVKELWEEKYQLEEGLEGMKEGVAIRIADLESHLKSQTGYSIALQRAIEAHCHGYSLSPEDAAKCSHHARLLAYVNSERERDDKEAACAEALK